MKTWEPITLANSWKSEGRKVEEKELRWRDATPTALAWTEEFGGRVPYGASVLQVRTKRGDLVVLAPDPIALALEPGQRAFPVRVPNSYRERTISPSGWIWLLADPVTDPVPPVPPT